jgi:metal-dependent amidase/aminoacylase/carboxypeptidase family protein
MANGELGIKEQEMAKLVADTMEEFGFTTETGLARTGVKATQEGKRPGPTVVLVGELDSPGGADHPVVNSDTCGHTPAGIMHRSLGWWGRCGTR